MTVRRENTSLKRAAQNIILIIGPVLYNYSPAKITSDILNIKNKF
jgi:hypothetical protein